MIDDFEVKEQEQEQNNKLNDAQLKDINIKQPKSSFDKPMLTNKTSSLIENIKKINLKNKTNKKREKSDGKIKKVNSKMKICVKTEKVEEVALQNLNENPLELVFTEDNHNLFKFEDYFSV